MKITLVAGARPNFMKIAPIMNAMDEAAKNGNDIGYRLVHTGQHYDKNMSGTFFEQLGIKQPDANLESGGGTQAEQTANIMIRFEAELVANPTDLVMVVGDVTSTMACSIVAKKLCVKVAHVEAGIRSGDMTMPEEVNRIVTDSITDYFFTTTEDAGNNLRATGVAAENIFFVGNTMIDTLLANEPRFMQPPVWQEANLHPKQYVVVTLHRPANVDDKEKLTVLVNEILANTHDLPVIFPVHPRTAKNLGDIHNPLMFTVPPMSYLEFNYLVKNARCVITDSGGITEETTVMRVPCITLRENTERPETVTIGTNELIGTDPAAIKPALEILFAGNWKKGGIPEKWDGKTAQRIVKYLLELDRVG